MQTGFTSKGYWVQLSFNFFYKVDVYMCQVIDLKTHESSYERQYNSHDL